MSAVFGLLTILGTGKVSYLSFSEKRKDLIRFSGNGQKSPNKVENTQVPQE